MGIGVRIIICVKMGMRDAHFRGCLFSLDTGNNISDLSDVAICSLLFKVDPKKKTGKPDIGS